VLLAVPYPVLHIVHSTPFATARDSEVRWSGSTTDRNPGRSERSQKKSWRIQRIDRVVRPCLVKIPIGLKGRPSLGLHPKERRQPHCSVCANRPIACHDFRDPGPRYLAAASQVGRSEAEGFEKASSQELAGVGFGMGPHGWNVSQDSLLRQAEQSIVGLSRRLYGTSTNRCRAFFEKLPPKVGRGGVQRRYLARAYAIAGCLGHQLLERLPGRSTEKSKALAATAEIGTRRWWSGRDS
jgi:hypothetical protein